ncbi:hypothetical protein ACVNP0_02945 [Staphylococcus aureus]
MIKDAQKVNIRTVIAPEHKKKQKNIENELKGEKKLMKQIAQHCKLKLNLKSNSRRNTVKVPSVELT